jgi:hypothetical protein
MRYRVQHALEQAHAAGIPALAAHISQRSGLINLAGVQLLILHRMPLAPRTLLLITQARLRGCKIAYESDDLTWDPAIRSYEHLDQHRDPATIRRILRTVERTALLMRRCDALIFSTTYLAQRAADDFGRPSFTCLNAVSQAMQQAAAALRPHSGDTLLRLGYFSGHAHVHDEDLASISEELAALLARYPHIRLTLVGEVATPAALRPWAERIERRALVPWQQLPAEIARVQINLAPLIDNPQRRAKSALKYLEAGMLGIPTIAADLPPYQEVVRHGETALLASTPANWQQQLTHLIEAEDERQRLGQAARHDVLSNHTTQVRASQYATMIERILHP